MKTFKLTLTLVVYRWPDGTTVRRTLAPFDMHAISMMRDMESGWPPGSEPEVTLR